MSELTHQFSTCGHCKKWWPGLRYTCPFCDWPRAHADETPPPTWGAVDQTKVIPTVPEQAVVVPTLSPTSPEGVGPDPILVVPVPQAAKLDPDAVQHVNAGAMQAAALRAAQYAPQSLILAPEGPPPAEPVAPAPLPLDAFETPKPRRRKKS